ncbi:MAG: NADH-quinone oxidoreductase subunit M [Dehalococcoidia bacterium]|nr:NADH-quinone oxidoreductase subunit M [Dehalococcoidia bacterium]MDW8119238.1 NADH-quinone oxidoreductase subunit M [Chloroflexota bacterium]
MLTATVFLPLVGALAIALFLSQPRQVRWFAAAVGIADFVLATLVFAGYDRQAGGLQWVERITGWVPSLKVEYYLGVDGLSATLVLLTGLLGLAAIFASWSIQERVKEYFAWLLVLQTAVMGVFTSLDFVLFFLFWELELIPMYFLIAIWGSGRREYSAVKFLVFTLTGSAFMLVGLLVVFFSTGTFNMADLAGLTGPGLDPQELLLPARVVWALFFIAFAVKLPIWPLHTWLPDAHTDAPTAVSVMLAGVLLKMGGYGLIRVNASMFPQVTQEAAFLLAVLGVVNIVYGAMVVFRQQDMKRLIAYSSISHMGLVVLGIASLRGVEGQVSPLGLTGAALQMFTHGTITGLLFVMVGLMYERTHTRYIPDLGGLARKMPFIATIFVAGALASLGLPSTSGFVAELTTLMGTFPVWGLLTALGALGIVLAAGYLLWLLQRSLFGPLPERWHHHPLSDATGVEKVAPLLLTTAIFVVGLFPAVVADTLTVGIEAIIQGRFT